MNTLEVSFSPERLQQLREIASRVQLAPEELIRVRIEEWLAKPDEEFVAATEYVLRKNAELYRRLA